MLPAISFDESISIGNIITIVMFAVFSIGSFYTFKERIAQIKIRIDACSLEQMKERVDTMWLFQLRRGLAELEKKELGFVSSPIELTEKAHAAIRPLVPQLKQFYQEVGGHDLGLIELAVKIEQRFGPMLTDTVCKNIGINDAACLVLAIAQLRPIELKDIVPVAEIEPRSFIAVA